MYLKCSCGKVRIRSGLKYILLDLFFRGLAIPFKKWQGREDLRCPMEFQTDFPGEENKDKNREWLKVFLLIY